MAKWIRVLAGSCECIAVVAKRLNLVEDYESLLEPKKAGERSFSVGSEREEAEDALVSQPSSTARKEGPRRGTSANDEYAGTELLERVDQDGGSTRAATLSFDDEDVDSPAVFSKGEISSLAPPSLDASTINPLLYAGSHEEGRETEERHIDVLPSPQREVVKAVSDTLATGLATSVTAAAAPTIDVAAPATESVADMISRVSASEWTLPTPAPPEAAKAASEEPAAPATETESVADMISRVSASEWTLSAPVPPAPPEEEQEPTDDSYAGSGDDGPGEHYAEGQQVDFFDPDNAEPQEDYRPGGYHSAEIGDVLNNRYQLSSRLGWGMYSTVWRGFDQVADGGARPVAIKIQKSQEDYYRAAQNEIRLLKIAASSADGDSFVVRLLDAFDVEGPHGQHPCMIFEELGESVFAVLQKYGQINVPATQAITMDVLEGLSFLHRCDILHSDLKPENVLVVRGPRSKDGYSSPGRIALGYDQDGNEDCIVGVKIVDLGNSFKIDEQDVEDIQTREYRCIEVGPF